jgi:hypothetical protein
MRVIRDDGHVLTDSVNITGATNTSPVVITANSHGFTAGQEVYIGAHSGGGSNVGGMTQLNQNRYIVDNETANTFELFSQLDGTTPVDGTGFGTYTSGGTALLIFELETPYAIEDVWELDYTQSADVMTLTHPEYEIHELSRTDHDAWTIDPFVNETGIASVTNLTVTPTTNNGHDWFYQVTAIDADTNEESEPTNVSEPDGKTPPPDNLIQWDAVAGAATYRVYRAEGSGTNAIGLLVETAQTEILDTKADSALDLTQFAPRSRTLFDDANEYPAAVGFYQQRRVFGGSNLDPDTSDYSQVASFSNFNYSNPINDADAIRATLNSQQVNQIRHYVPLNDLIIFTSGSEWRVNSGSENIFGPNTIRQFPQSNYGCSHYQPIVIGNTILFVTEDLGNVRSLGYNLEIDGYKGNNLNILSRHLIDGYAIADWAYHRVPDPRIYIIRNDGIALTLSYDQEQEVIAWTRMDTLGDYEAVQVLRGGGTYAEDSVYFVVKRRVNGNTVRYIEVMRDTWFNAPEDCFFVDSGLSLDSPLIITNITSADPVVVTSTSHGLSNGDTIDLSDIVWYRTINTTTGVTTTPDHLNGGRYLVANATTHTFELTDEDGNDIDGSDFAVYKEGGYIREAVDTVTGLEHLEGEEVVCLCDGNVITGETVSSATIEFDRKFSRIHIGLPNIADIETLNIEHGQGTIQGMDKKVSNVTIRLHKTRGLLIGPDEENLVELRQREDETYGSPIDLFTGDRQVYLHPSWGSNGRIFIRQKNPLPLTVLAVIPELEVSDT